MNSVTSLCVAIILSVCVHQAQLIQAADHITKACEVTRYKDLCEQTLRADPASANGDVHTLAKVALRAAAKKSKSMESQVATLLKSTTDAYTKQALTDCAENFEGASEQIADSLTAIESRRYGDVLTWVSASFSDGDSCEEGFKPGTSKLTKDNQLFGELLSNVLALTNLAKG